MVLFQKQYIFFSFCTILKKKKCGQKTYFYIVILKRQKKFSLSTNGHTFWHFQTIFVLLPSLLLFLNINEEKKRQTEFILFTCRSYTKCSLFTLYYMHECISLYNICNNLNLCIIAVCQLCCIWIIFLYCNIWIGMRNIKIAGLFVHCCLI